MTSININKLIRQLLPPFLRQKSRLAWLDSLFNPEKAAWDGYEAWRNEKFYEARVTPQTISIEAYLNRLFDAEQKRIKVEHGESKDFYLYYSTVPGGKYINADTGVFIYQEGEYSEKVVDGFIVSIPNEINQPLLIGTIDKVKAANTKYEIKKLKK